MSRLNYSSNIIKSSAYGKTQSVVYGSARVQGNVIWASDLTETEGAAGSITGSNSVELNTQEYTYSASFAVAFSDAGVEAIERIWADGKLIYDGLLTDKENLLTNGNLNTWSDSTTPGTWSTSGTIARSTTVDPDIEDSAYSAKLSTGTSATNAEIYQDVTFASTNQHHFRFRVYGGDSNPQWCRCVVSFADTNHEPWFRVPTGRWTTIEGYYTPSAAGTESFKITIRDVANCDVYIDSVSVMETTANMLEGDATNFEMEIFLGTEEQAASEIIKANHIFGEDFVPAYRGQAYVVFGDMPLLSFNNRIPAIEAQVQSYEKGTQDMIEDVCERCGLDPGEYDVSDMSDTFTGMLTTSERTGEDMLAPIKEAAPFAVRETGMRVEFQSLSSLSSSRSFGEEDLNARGPDEEPDTALTIELADDAMLPIEVVVTALDPEYSQQESTQRARTGRIAVGSNQSYNWPLIASADQIRQWADVLLARAWMEARTFIWAMGSDNMDLQPGDIVTITRGDEDVLIRIIDIEVSALGVLSCTGIEYSSNCFDSDSIGSQSDGPIAIPATS